MSNYCEIQLEEVINEDEDGNEISIFNWGWTVGLTLKTIL